MVVAFNYIWPVFYLSMNFMDITDSSDEELIVDQDNGEFGPPNYVALTPDDGAGFIATGTYNHTSGY